MITQPDQALLPEYSGSIWIIDDSRMDCLIVEKYFRLYFPGVSVRSFTDAREALERLLDLPENDPYYPHLILLDIYLPGMDGWQFIESYRAARGGKLPAAICVLTSSIDPRDYRRIQSYGLEYLVKPVGITELGNTLRRVVPAVSFRP
jgi:CheY-like chemotaxis protein